jgi:hypothetical protein
MTINSATVPGNNVHTAEDSGLVVVSVNNFDSETFSFPTHDDASLPYATLTDSERRVIHFSILRS